MAQTQLPVYVKALQVAVLCAALTLGEGVLSLRGASLPTDGSGRILITDINPSGINNDDALTCHIGIGEFETGNFFLHPTNQSTNDADSIKSRRDGRGWDRRRDRDSNGNRLVFLRRVSDTALEGVVTCGDDEATISIGVYYPILSVGVSIEVLSAREREYRVNCTSVGGAVLTSSFTGPGVVGSTQQLLEPLGELERRGNDTFSVSTGILSGGSDGDTYECLALNGVYSNNSSDGKTLRVAGPPTFQSAVAVPPGTTIRVEWSQPSGGASVTGYVVHYSDGSTDRSLSVAASSTSTDITGLVKDGRTYSISVEATSEQLSGESPIVDVVLRLGRVVDISVFEVPYLLSLTWLPPHAPVGVVAGYVVSLWSGNSPDNVTEWNTMQADTSITVYGVETQTQYTFTVTAYSRFGAGESTVRTHTTSFQTEVAVQLRLSGVFNCRAWTSNNCTTEKLSDISSALLQAIRDTCQCNYEAFQISVNFFRCFEESNDYAVTYRARLLPSPEANTSFLVSTLEAWLARERYEVMVGGVSLSVDSHCSVEVENLQDEECRSTDTSIDGIDSVGVALVVVGVALVGVVLLFVAVLATSGVAYLRKRKKEKSSREEIQTSFNQAYGDVKRNKEKSSREEIQTSVNQAYGDVKRNKEKSSREEIQTSFNQAYGDVESTPGASAEHRAAADSHEAAGRVKEGGEDHEYELCRVISEPEED